MTHTEKIQLVVMNEHTLGYIFPEQPQSLHILQSSVLRGSTLPNDGQSVVIGSGDTVRLASQQDFNDFRVVMDG
jgi:hypothetical protein